MDPAMTHGSSAGPEDTMTPVAAQPSAPAWTEDADCDFGHGAQVSFLLAASNQLSLSLSALLLYCC